MAKKQKKTATESLEDLVEYAHKLRLPDGAFDGDLQDAADMDAELAYETVKDAVLLEQLEFLYLRGWQLVRLKEMIKELAEEKTAAEGE